MNNGYEELVELKTFDDFKHDKDGASDFFYMLNVHYFLDKIGNAIHIINIDFAFTQSLISTKPISKWIYKNVDGDDWVVYESRFFKFTVNKSGTYHCFFSKCDGLNLRWGKTIDEDPKYCGLGPEIMDLEISVNGCAPVPGSTNCRYCYKNNTTAAPTNMTFDTFVKIVETFPRNLSQIAFGITGLSTNLDMERMFKWCRQNGIIPNVTTVGADLTPGLTNVLCYYCGAVAVSCYTGAKEHCYSVIKTLKDWAKEHFNRDMHINMHIVVSKDNMEHVRSVLNDIKNGKVPGLRSVVFLRIKPKGRACHMDCVVPQEIYNEIVTFCLDNHISFGFDSCSAYPVMETLKALGKSKLCDAAEPCESGFFSSYINVYGMYWNCSFAEGNVDFIKPINVLDYVSSTIWWNSEKLDKIRNYKTPACKSCPIYKLD